MGKKQHSFSDRFRIKHTDSRLARTRSPLYKCDCFSFFTHFCKVGKCFSLMFSQFKYFTALVWHITVKIRQCRRISEKCYQFIFDSFRCFIYLCISPAKYFPTVMNHAVLFQQVINILFLRYFIGIMPCFTVNFKCNLAVLRHDCKINRSVIAVYIYKRVL